LGRRIRSLRDARGWSQERLAEHANLDRSYLAGIETGARNPSLKVLALLAKALQVRIAALFEDEGAEGNRLNNGITRCFPNSFRESRSSRNSLRDLVPEEGIEPTLAVKRTGF
jgi:transcriptional regulator with XRE-family HTH domain